MNILITGATSGLGLELTRYFNDKGHSLILQGRHRSINKIKNIFSKHMFLCIDFLKDDILEQISIATINMTPDVIIHCAGSRLDNDCHPIDVKILEKTIALNLNSAIVINNFFINMAINENKKVRIIHISSDSGITGKASPCYSISKGALNTYIKNAGRIYAMNNIMICGVICGIFEHENSSWSKKKKDNLDYYNKVKNSTTLKRFAHVSEVSEVVISIAESANMLYSAELINATAGNI